MLQTDQYCEDVECTLCVDMDHTLLLTDTLYETIVRFILQSPYDVWRFPFWLFAGKARLKREIASKVHLDCNHLPVNTPLLDWIVAEHASGRPLALVSAADQKIVDGVACRLGIFQFAIGSDGEKNLQGRAKLAAIRERVGLNFDYVGDSKNDLPIFEEARRSVLVGNVKALSSRISGRVRVERKFPATRRPIADWFSAIRVHQWSKNALVFLPLFLAGSQGSAYGILATTITFFMLSFFASAGYIFNDILDLDADRQHVTKRFRPFASGSLAIRDGAFGVLLLLAGAAITGLVIGPYELLLGCVYFLLSVTYTLYFKRMPVLDLIILAFLYTFRIVIGAVAADVAISYWLITFSMFFFLSLAAMKRYGELRDFIAREPSNLHGRGYSTDDSVLMLALGSGAAVTSSSVFVNYLLMERFPAKIYSRPEFLWCVFPILLYWTIRSWHLTVHGKMNADPVLFALRDRLSQVLGIVIALMIILAW